MSVHSMGRRRFLRGMLATGAGVTLGLPTLESLLHRGSRARADSPTPPKRFLVWFWGNGIVPERWIPTETGAVWTPPAMLARIATPELRPYVSVVTNAEIKSAWQPHAGGASGALCGSYLNDPIGSNGTPQSASIDQVIANAIDVSPGGLRSLELAGDRHFSGVAGTVYNYISHRGPGMPNEYDRDPRSVFRRLFGTVESVDPYSTFRGSVLDAVLADANSLTASLTASDRARLDQHMTSIRELETRIAASAGPTCTAPTDPSGTVSDSMIEDEFGTVMNFTMMNDTMMQLLATALACDLTRVASYMYTGPAAFTRYFEAPDVPHLAEYPTLPEATHAMAHLSDGSTPNTPLLAGMEAALNETMRHFGRSLEIFRNTPDGTGNLLDNLVVYGTSCTGYGPLHSHTEYPLVVAGLAGGAIRGGTHHRFAGTPGNAARVPFTLAHAVGADIASFGLAEAQTSDVISELLT
ncbi:MAG: DUF1552 domain-containing protein [Sandaracinaceae bacterium]|jgi:hypothetical protein|nr:DUF1552 domain-containing protein [Sandaracinaceae bacterium]